MRRVALVVCLVAAVVTPAVAQQGPGDPGPPTADLFDTREDELSQQRIDEALARQQVERGRRASREGREERAGSRQDLGDADLSDSEAFALLRRAADLDEARPVEPVEDVVKYLNNSTAVVDAPGARNALVRATEPLRTPGEGGREQPVSTELEASGGEPLEPENAVAEYRISRKATTGVLFDEKDFSFRHAGADPGADVLMRDDLAFFGEVDPGIDVLQRSLPQGVQTFHSIREPGASERIVQRFELPEGGRLVLARSGPGGGAADRRTSGVRGHRRR